MTSHRRPGLLQRWRLRPSARTLPIPPQRRPGMELVDARSRITHLISPEAMLDGRRAGVWRALCGAQVLAASLTNPGCGHCRRCGS